MYLSGIGGAWLLASRRLNRFDPTWNKEKLSDLVFWASMGVIVGGRLGYVLFYDLQAYVRSEEHTSELQSLMRISYAVFCLKKKRPNKMTSDTSTVRET